MTCIDSKGRVWENHLFISVSRASCIRCMAPKLAPFLHDTEPSSPPREHGWFRKLLIKLGMAWPLDIKDCTHPKAAWELGHNSLEPFPETYCTQCGAQLRQEQPVVQHVTAQGRRAGMR